MTHDDIKSRITPHLSAFKAVRDAVDLAEKTVNTADRERIAELERDLAHARASQSETTARTIIAFCNESVGFAALGNSHVETAVKALYHRLTEARANLAQNAAITETLRAENERLRAGIVGAWNEAVVGREGVGSMAAITGPVVEEAQGPWVIVDAANRFCFDSTNWTGNPKSAIHYKVKAEAEEDTRQSHGERVITLAEARRIAGAK